MTTREQAIAAAGAAVAEARALRDSLPPEEAARLAYTPTGPSVEELTERIRTSRMPRTPHAGSGHDAPAGPHGGGTGRGPNTTSATKSA